MTRKRRRLYLVLAGMVSLCGAAALVLNAFNDDLVFFYSPTDLKTKSVPFERQLRIGGLVEEHSVAHEANGRTIDFRVTDGNNTVSVIYPGSLPDLFREGQGVVAEGRLRRDGVFQASNVLAKHDENYMPPEVAEALKKSGHWQEGAGMPAGTARAGTATADTPKTEAAQ
jgi:cytochrome c-type biogenesis protein CcmE